MKKIYILFLINFVFQALQAQDGNFSEYQRQYLRIMFYNTENLFDVLDDSLKSDETFTPEGGNRWTQKRFEKKIMNISKVVTAVGGWEAPEIIGFCEIENRFVLQELISKTPLKNIPYDIIHYESPDNRGIDVGLIYRKDKFKPISSEAVTVRFPFDNNKPTRDILYVKGETKSGDTLHIFVNHWPSRMGGQAASDPKRRYAASVVRNKVDSLFNTDINPKIIIMGDLNDYPDNESLTQVLKAKPEYENIQSEELYNLAFYLQNSKNKGTHKHEAHWGVLDQIIISGALLDISEKIFTTKDDAHVFDAPYLLEKDENQTGFRTFRTYIGMEFHDGYSDHLPVYLDIRKK